jgi:hypothetical protein
MNIKLHTSVNSLWLFSVAKKPIGRFHAFTSIWLETVTLCKEAFQPFQQCRIFCGLKVFHENSRSWTSRCSVPLRTNDLVFVSKTPDSEMQERKMVLQKWAVQVNIMNYFHISFSCCVLFRLRVPSVPGAHKPTPCPQQRMFPIPGSWLQPDPGGQVINGCIFIYSLLPDGARVSEEQWLTFFSASIKFPVESEAVVGKI